MNTLLLMMAGSGVRFGADVPKQFIKVKDKPIFTYILKAYQSCEDIDRIVAVTHKDWIEYVTEWKQELGIDKLHTVVAGGETRSESVKNGLIEISRFADKEDVILIHDATHPYVDKKGTREIIEAVKKYGGATLGQFQYDTVYQMNEETNLLEKVVPRQQIVSGASPEAFMFKDIYNIYINSTQQELESMTSAGAIALAHNIPMKVIRTDLINLKITYPGDMTLFYELIDFFFPEEDPYK